MSTPLSAAVQALSSSDPAIRVGAGTVVYHTGRALADHASYPWWSDAELSALLLGPNPVVTVGLAVERETFAKIHEANGSPRLAEVPPEQDAEEFEMHLPGGTSVDVLTTKEPGGSGAIAKYLAKFGEGVQQVEFRCANVDRATRILREKFGVSPVYPETRGGADGTRVNFFLVSAPGVDKVLIELYEPAPAVE